MVDPWEEEVETTSLTLAALVSGRLLLQVSETRILFWPWSEKNIALDLRWVFLGNQNWKRHNRAENVESVKCGEGKDKLFLIVGPGDPHAHPLLLLHPGHLVGEQDGERGERGSAESCGTVSPPTNADGGERCEGGDEAENVDRDVLGAPSHGRTTPAH